MNQKTGEDQVPEKEVTPTEVSLENSEPIEAAPEVDQVDELKQEAELVETPSIQADTHASRRSKKSNLPTLDISKFFKNKKWPSMLGLGLGAVALIALVTSGILSQYFKNKAMPGVSVAGALSSAKDKQSIQQELEKRVADFKITLKHEELNLQPEAEDLGLSYDIEKTVESAMSAKRNSGFITRLKFWQKADVPLVYNIDQKVLDLYVEEKFADFSTPPQDAHLEFDAARNIFGITGQADGKGVDISSLKQDIADKTKQIDDTEIAVKVITKSPKITEASLEKLVVDANEVVNRSVVLTGLGTSFKAKPADIAAWVTPTPQEDGVIRLVIDPAKVQSYVDAIGKHISNQPQDRKVLRDKNTGQEVVLQEGRAGTTLQDSTKLAESITKAIRDGQDISQTMNIKVADFTTVSMEAFDRWVEVDLSAQRVTLYTGSTPVHSFIISSGLPRTPTVTGEFKVWYKNTSQTMSGGSRAAGDYYNLPNVTWNTYFYKDYAFHTAYWHNNFGQPMSHGCVNMREADAKVLYDFAPVGTTVIVHH